LISRIAFDLAAEGWLYPSCVFKPQTGQNTSLFEMTASQLGQRSPVSAGNGGGRADLAAGRSIGCPHR
jgi:hypothetical protein